MKESTWGLILVCGVVITGKEKEICKTNVEQGQSHSPHVQTAKKVGTAEGHGDMRCTEGLNHCAHTGATNLPGIQHHLIVTG